MENLWKPILIAIAAMVLIAVLRMLHIL